MLTALDHSPFRSHRWYLLDICVVNAWLLYRRDTAAREEKSQKPKMDNEEEGREERRVKVRKISKSMWDRAKL